MTHTNTVEHGHNFALAFKIKITKQRLFEEEGTKCNTLTISC